MAMGTSKLNEPATSPGSVRRPNRQPPSVGRHRVPSMVGTPKGSRDYRWGQVLLFERSGNRRDFDVARHVKDFADFVKDALKPELAEIIADIMKMALEDQIAAAARVGEPLYPGLVAGGRVGDRYYDGIHALCHPSKVKNGSCPAPPKRESFNGTYYGSRGRVDLQQVGMAITGRFWSSQGHFLGTVSGWATENVIDARFSYTNWSLEGAVRWRVGEQGSLVGRWAVTYEDGPWSDDWVLHPVGLGCDLTKDDLSSCL